MNARLIAVHGKHLTKNAILQQRIIERCVLINSINSYYGRRKIGKREVVGFGVNGSYIYFDRPDFPMPAIRFREDDAALTSLRAKEKGNWKQLTLDEKKTLYRASFCSTFAEITAPTGEWKAITAGVVTLVATSLVLFALMKKFVMPPMPESLTLEAKKEQMRKMIILGIDPVEGLSSKWDYENNRWKE
ncbi:cytochrome c oxidase polypeptide IV-like protein [Leptotrombidium deliense]|uniref:Cytochrome c oxidase subunit 4 n=1 Tax=Leptotrombidium deliense TaxID=299467 RepID=A0A443S9Y5_9ACAR|nr:cytochrome c oxidase polypeptide IV-like protein [Leptotrombidium deliense]